MPVILNLIKGSLKQVTVGAEGGCAIAPVFLFLLYFSHSVHLSEPFTNLLLLYDARFSRVKDIAKEF